MSISSSRLPFWCGDARHTPFIDSSRINNAPITNPSMILVSTVKNMQVYSSTTDTNEAHAWWNGAQSLWRHVLLLSATSPTQWGSSTSVRDRNISHRSSVTDGSFDQQDKGDFEAFCMQPWLASAMMTWKCNDGYIRYVRSGRGRDGGSEGDNAAVDNNDIDGDNEDQMSKRGYMSLLS